MGLPVRYHFDCQLGIRRHDNGPGEQCVGADRHHEQRLDFGPDDGPTSAEIIGRRPGRGRTYDTVAAPAREWPVVDLDDDFKHASTSGLFDGRLVERPVAFYHPVSYTHLTLPTIYSV